VSAGIERQLTNYGHTPGKSAGNPCLKSNPKLNPNINPNPEGAAEFVMQEEFDRYSGYFWSPVASRREILYLEVDETSVATVTVAQPLSNGTEEYRYPRAGQANSSSELCIVTLASDLREPGYETGLHGKTRRLEPPLSQRLPWVEYIVRLGWAEGGDVIWAIVLDRRQKHLAVVFFDRDEFVEEPGEEPVIHLEGIFPRGVLIEEWSQTWVTVHELFHVFDDGSARILWGSEQNGYRSVHMLEWPMEGYDHILEPSKASLRRIIVNAMGWEVDKGHIWVDSARELIYFMANKDGPLEQHVYVASLSVAAAGRDPIRITELGHNFSGVLFSHDMDMFVATYSSASTLPRTALYSIGPTGKWRQSLLISGNEPTVALSETLCIPKALPLNVDLTATLI